MKRTKLNYDVNVVCNTNGRGCWSNRAAPVSVVKVTLSYLTEDKGFGELRAKFTSESWNVQESGFIYTDPCWLRDFRQAMRTIFKLSEEAVSDIDYSEQGMQGSHYVSMDVGEIFIKEWLKI